VSQHGFPKFDQDKELLRFSESELKRERLIRRLLGRKEVRLKGKRDRDQRKHRSRNEGRAS